MDDQKEGGRGMKCAAAAVMRIERYNFRHRKYGEILLDWSETAAVYYAVSEYKTLRDGRQIQRMLDDIQEWMIDAVTGAIPDNLRMREGGKSWWAYDVEREEDAIQNVLYRWQRDFRDHGFRDWTLSQMEPGPLPEVTGWMSKDTLDARTARAEYMSTRGRDALRMFTLCYLCWMAEQERGGKRRFAVERIDDMIYVPYAAEMRVFLQRFLSGDKAETERMSSRLASMKAWLAREHGIMLADVTEDKQVSAIAEPANGDSETVKAFESLMKGAGGFAGVVMYR